MQKTRLGITVGLLGAAIFFSSIFSGQLVAIILAGYVLLFEENAWLKRSAVKAVVLMMGFSLLVTSLNLIPNLLDFMNNIAIIFNGSFNIVIVNKIILALVNGVGIVEKVLFIALGVKALNQGTVVIPAIDTFISKYMD